MAWVIQLSDDAGTVVDFLSTNSAYRLVENGFQMPPPQKRSIQGGPSFFVHGQKIVNTTWQNRTIRIQMDIVGATREAIGSSIATLEKMLERSRQRQDMNNSGMSVAFKLQLDGMSSATYFRVLDGTFSLPQEFLSAGGVHWGETGDFYLNNCILEIICEPFSYSASPHLSWEDASGDLPDEIPLRNDNTSGAWSTGGVQVDNAKHTSDGTDNILNLRASDVGGEQQAATIMVMENTSPDFEDFGKVYIGAALGIEHWTLNGAIDNSQTTMVVDEDLTPYRPKLVLKIDTEELLVTAINKTTKTLTVTRGHNSTTPASHTDNTTIKVLSLNPLLDSTDGDYTGLSSPDSATNRTLATGAVNGSYYELSITGTTTKDLVSWTLDEDVVAAQQGLVRFFGRLSAQGTGGQAAGRFWSQKCLYRLVFKYISRSGTYPVVHSTPWITPLDGTTQLLDFASVRLPPFGVSGQDNVSGIEVTIQAKIKSAYTSDTIYLNVDYLYMLPIEYGYRVLESRGEGLARGDKMVDDGWQGLPYVIQIASYPSGEELGKASILNPYMSPIWLQPGFDQRLFFLQESETGITDPTRRFSVTLYAVNSFMSLVV